MNTRINRYFFEHTNELHDEIVSLHDFVQPTATALWNFRKTISNDIISDSLITVSTLSKKYNTAPGTRGSTNLIAPFSKTTWENQRERLAEVALVNIIALYEMWCENICETLGRSDLTKRMQFPTNATMSSGIVFAINEIVGSNKGFIESSIYPSLTKTKKYSIKNIDNLMKCFRYFKELRNCFMHRGRECEGKLYGAQSEFLPVANEIALGMSFVPEHKVVKPGEKISISLHGVLGFTEVILRIVTTVDAELSKAHKSEDLIAGRIGSAAQAPISQSKLRNTFSTMGIQGASITPDLLAFLKNKGVVV